ncbi:hypothetical protein FRC00_014053 [Tulasnella sp. 408]|nr:hypothetical protein FRC00_014053 [Tulasnella sp. 408]
MDSVLNDDNVHDAQVNFQARHYARSNGFNFQAYSTTTTPSPTCVTNLPTFTAKAIKATTPNTPVTGSSLQRRSDGRAVLNWSSAVFPALRSNTFCFIEDGPGGCKYKDYINIYNDETIPYASYKVLKFELSAPITTYWSTTDWGVSSDSPWGAQSWFLACATPVTGEYLLYLQTGSDVPPGQTCYLTEISW